MEIILSEFHSLSFLFYVSQVENYIENREGLNTTHAYLQISMRFERFVCQDQHFVDKVFKATTRVMEGMC